MKKKTKKPIKLNDKIKGLSIELDKSTQLFELNVVIDKFKKETNSKYDVKISLTFDASYSTLHLKRVRKPYLTLATKDGQEIKINKKNTVKKKK